MLNSIINAVCQSIASEFGTSYKIYTEKVLQGFTPPCFSIAAVYSKNEIFLGRRHKSTNVIAVTFYGGDANTRETINDIMLRLPSALEYITPDCGKMQGTNITSEKGDNSYTCTVNYDFFYYTDSDTSDTELMETLSQKQTL